MGAGIHIVFGRANSDEMKYYEEMSGMVNKETVQTSVNANSEFDENYSVSKGQRVTVTREAAMEGAQIRVRDFQEVSVFMIDRGRVMKGFVGKMNFPKSTDFKTKKNTEGVDFSRYATFAVADDKEKEDAENAQKRETAKDDVRNYQTNITGRESQDAYIMNTTSLPTPGVMEDIKSRPQAVSETARARAGKSDILLTQVMDKSAIDRILEEAASKDTTEEISNADLVAEQQMRYEQTVDITRQGGAQPHRHQTADGRRNTVTRVDYSDPITLQAKEKAAIERKKEEALKNINNDPMDINFADMSRKGGRSWMNPIQNQPAPADVNVSDDDLDDLTKALDNPASHI